MNMNEIETVSIDANEIDRVEMQGDKTVIVLKASKMDIDWGHIYYIEIVHGAYKDRFYGYFGYKRDRIIEIYK